MVAQEERTEAGEGLELQEPEQGTAEAPGGAARATASDDEAREEALRQQRLLRVMQGIDAQPDLAAVKASMLNLQQLSRSERSHVRALTALIHDDPAMLSKLLRLVNAAFYRSVGGGEITSMARAVQLLGFQKLGMLASSLRLLEALPKGSDGARLQQEFARAQLAALLAQDFCHSARHADSIHLAALFQRLGDLLAGLHFAEEARVIDDQLDIQELAPESAARQRARDRLARAQWGLSIEEIGHEVARSWGWPPALLASMRSLEPASPDEGLAGDDYARVLCTAANGLAGELLGLPATGSAEEQALARAGLVRGFAARFAVPLGLDAETLDEAVEHTHGRWRELVRTLGLTLLAPGEAAPAPARRKLDPNSREYRQNLAENLADAIEQLRRMNRRAAPLPELLDAALRLLVKSLDLQRAVACLADPATGALQGRMGVGDKAAVLAPFFEIPLRPPTELFGLLCARNADTLIRDVADPVIAGRLPPWFGQRVKAGTFLVLPLVTSSQQVVGMLYGDRREPGELVVHERGLALLRDLRHQVLTAVTRPRAPASPAG